MQNIIYQIKKRQNMNLLHPVGQASKHNSTTEALAAKKQFEKFSFPSG